MTTATISAVEYHATWNPTEAEFQQCVVDAAQRLGWKVFHPYDMRRSTAGWPDLAIAKPHHLILWELKTNRGKIRPEQLDWIAVLETVPGVTCGIVRPRDWDNILAILRRHDSSTMGSRSST